MSSSSSQNNPSINPKSNNSSHYDPNKMIRKSPLIEQFINFLMIVRLYLTQVPLWAFALILFLLYLFKIKREGNTPTSILVISAMLSGILGEYFQIGWLYLMAPLLAGISHFFSYKIYWFPKVKQPIGFRQQVLENDLYMIELYPVKKNQNCSKKVIPWNYRLELAKIMQFENSSNFLYLSLYKFFVSSINKHKLFFASGDQEKTDKAIIWSHGRTTTPLMFSQILVQLMQLSNQKFNICAVQHTQKRQTGQTQIPKMKKFRQIEVQARAAQTFASIQYCKNKKQIILMGHSYGCSTVIQAYHTLPSELKAKVTHIVLLDPWFFPLTEAKLIQQIKCPILILANEYFVQNEDVFNRNNKFLKAHEKEKIIYLVWKFGDHLHQTDLGFIFGNTFGIVKHHELSLEMLNKNIQAIKVFLQNPSITQTKMRQIFESQILDDHHKPEKFMNTLNF